MIQEPLICSVINKLPQWTTFNLRARGKIVTSRFRVNLTMLFEVFFYHFRETGSKQRLQRWSRGVLVFVSAGGIIRQFAPLYKSEGPGQVFSYSIYNFFLMILKVALLMIRFLQLILNDVLPDEWDQRFLAYDNMYV